MLKPKSIEINGVTGELADAAKWLAFTVDKGECSQYALLAEVVVDADKDSVDIKLCKVSAKDARIMQAVTHAVCEDREVLG